MTYSLGRVHTCRCSNNASVDDHSSPRRAVTAAYTGAAPLALLKQRGYELSYDSSVLAGLTRGVRRKSRIRQILLYIVEIQAFEVGLFESAAHSEYKSVIDRDVAAFAFLAPAYSGSFAI